MLDPKLLEEIDACRPGSRDVEQPELSRLAAALSSDAEVHSAYANVQRFDAHVGSAMHELPVPAGLAGRILQRLQSTQSSASRTSGTQSSASRTSGTQSAVELAIDSASQPTSSQAAEFKVPSSIAASAAEGVSPDRLTRRRLIVVSSVLAASVLVALGVVRLGWQKDSSPIAVTEKAAGWYDRLGDGWQPMTKLPKGFAVPSGIGGPARGWQVAAKTVAASGVVYDLGQGQPGSAVLFVLKAVRPDLPATAPRAPQSTTAGLAIGAWQSGGLMYVLVVRGDERTYKKLFHPVQPLA